MMASIGLVGQHFLKLPGFEQSPAGFSVMGRGEGVLGFFGIFLLCGLLELAWREEPGSDREPGNYGDPFGVNMYNDEMRMKELNNGRMAMISVLGIFAAEIATGKDAMQQFGLPALGGQVAASSSASRSSFAGRTSSRVAAQQSILRRAEAVVEDVPPLFQPSEQFGATEPLGFFDPLGFTAVGDERGFRKLQVSEIKHGRVAMVASIGLVGQHFLKLPGFEQSPAGFSVMGRGEGVLGFFGIFLLCGLLELAWREEPGSDREPGNYGDPFGVNMYNDEMRMKELNNGRMAMISVLGIFAAEIATGKDAMQQFGLPALGGQVASSSSASRSSFAGRTSSRVAAQQSILRRAEAVVEDVPPLFQPSEQFGATEPLGFFDPLGFTAVGDERGFRKLQVSEIKHGRVAMMASIGLVGQHFLKLPGFEQSPAGFSVMGRGEGVLGFFGIFLLCGLLELAWREEPGSDREPGNYGDPFGVNMYNDEMRMKELNNGRMAMISVLGIFAAEIATGKDAMQQFGLPALGGQVASSSSASRSSFAGRTSSRVAAQQSILRRAEAVVEDVPPLFQPSEQFGATEPLGFFDPLGFTAVGDERGFRKLQVSEIKHGRVAMMASIGLVGQHFLKLPGFEQSPAGFSVMGRGEGVLGFFGIFLLCGLLELAWREEPGSDREPGNYGDPFGVNMYNDEMRMKELNNGRMAMISVLGIFAAEIATGKDAMQQFGLPALGGQVASSSSASRSSFAGRTSSRVAAQQSILRRAEAVVEDVPPLFQPSEQFGATEPLGFFDPLGFTAVGDERGFRKLQVSEIKHGRVAMMASIGLVGQHFLKLPGFEQSPAGFSVMGRGEGVLGFFGIFLLCGLLELAWREEPGSDREPGNYGDPFGVNLYNDEMRMKELNNGRMAMISVLGIFAAEIATGKDAMQQFGLPALGGQVASSSSASRSSFAGRTSSRVAAQQSILRRAEAVVEDVPPLFQPSEQFGATEPLGFFDPLGFTAVGDERGFRKLQVSEIKHGRVAMMASIGLVGQHFLKLPGFEQSPAGFSVMGRGEGVLGFFGIFLLCGLLELAWREEPGSDREPGNYGDPFGVNMYNDEMRMKELNNGRMAMISVLGIFAAEIATGKDAIQQFGF
ncbi:unnamed protein product [Effrenium voratum]|uniref:Uncharacterized protein n=1 Tax=Effrenium voratum TaxID=2562239 RepID=A0AA36N0W4_9DINO|nr:unnamed protein product [Effrenium voratum]